MVAAEGPVLALDGALGDVSAEPEFYPSAEVALMVFSRRTDLCLEVSMPRASPQAGACRSEQIPLYHSKQSGS